MARTIRFVPENVTTVGDMISGTIPETTSSVIAEYLHHNLVVVLVVVIIPLVFMTIICLLVASLVVMIVYMLYEFVYSRVFENDGEGNSDLEEAAERRRRRRRQSKYQRLMMKLHCVEYGSGETETKSGECAICLEDYNVGELCRIMPECSHMFHVDCIDNWLNLKISCPMCRRCVFNLMTEPS